MQALREALQFASNCGLSLPGIATLTRVVTLRVKPINNGQN